MIIRKHISFLPLICLIFSLNHLSVQAAVQTFENFDTNWPGTPWTTYSNNIVNPVSGWTVNRAQIASNPYTNTAPYDCALDKTTNSWTAWVQSPALSGAGAIRYYAKGQNSTAANPLYVAVESSYNGGANWSALFTNTATTNLLLAYTNTFSMGDPNTFSNQLVRLRPISTNAYLVFMDTVVIDYPSGSSVTASNISLSPASPTFTTPITIAADLYPSANAAITNMLAWYRVGATGLFDYVSMTNSSGNHYVSVSPIIGTAAGSTFQYFIECDYTGFMNTSPSFFPIGGTNSVAISSPADYRTENFDSNWPIWSGYFTNNMVNPVTGWSVNRAQIQTNLYNTPPAGCTLESSGLNTNTAWVRSPLLTNGVGALSCFVRGNTASVSQPLNLAIECSYDGGTSWVTNAVVTFTNNSWTGVTNVFLTGNSASTSNQIIRLRTISVNNYPVQVDSIKVTYPPALVSITNVMLNPGYPVAGATATVSCDIISLNPNSPAFNITPLLSCQTSNSAALPPTTNSMTRTSQSGSTNHFTSQISLANVGRDTVVTYNIAANFSGYYGLPIENKSPTYYPGPASNQVASFMVRAFSSLYTNVSANINATNTFGRLLGNGLWQSIINVSTSAFTFSLQGLGYSTGFGYSTNTTTWGNSNNWQTAIPLADIAGIGQSNITISVSNGQYMVRFDESTGQYLVNSCVYQDFDKPGIGNGTLYQTTLISSTPGGAQQDFDLWPWDTTRTRTETFNTWTNDNIGAFTRYTNGVGFGNSGWLIYSSKVTSAIGGSGLVIQTATNTPSGLGAYTYSFIVQPTHWGFNPLRGVGPVTVTFAAAITNPAANLAMFLCPTNNFTEPPSTQSVYTAFQDQGGAWISGLVTNLPVSNTTFQTSSFMIATNNSFDVIFSQTASGTQSVYIDSASVSDWYSEPLTTNDDGWVGSGYFIEPSAAPGVDNCCRLDTTRSTDPNNQFIRTPKLGSGVKYIEVFYAGDRFQGASPVPISFNLELSYGDLNVWTNLITISTNYNFAVATNYFSYRHWLNMSTPNVYVRVRNTTPRPGALLLDQINVPGYATSNDWSINNGALIYTTQKYPPAPRQFYYGACYLNNSTNQNLDSGTNAPNISRPSYIRSPYMPRGIGEISFWYRNWATNAPVTPGKLVIQTAVNDTFENDWTVTNIVLTVTNIVNTNDYVFFQTYLYDLSNRYVRIYNYSPGETNLGRICIDDFMITDPLAATLSMSNLVVTPSIPIYTNAVDVSVDIYHPFLNPWISGLTAYYGTAASYSGLTGAATTPLAMTCIASNFTGGTWYRYKTSSPIPAQSIDTFVKYLVKASFTGFMASAVSPVTRSNLESYPSWYTPLSYGTGTAFYITFSCSTGTVWFNEVNYSDNGLSDFSKQYIELCGLAGANIQNWHVKIDDQIGNSVASYAITSNYTLANSNAGHGFWVLGKVGVTNVNQYLTNSYAQYEIDASQSLPVFNGGLLTLIRSCGAYEHKACYENVVDGYMFLGIDDYVYGSGSAGLRGSGIYSYNFTGQEMDGQTPGAVNGGQTLIMALNAPPTVIISAFWINTNVWIRCSTTNSWYPTPLYSTNLLMTNAWTSVSSYSSSLTSSNCLLNFTPPGSATTYFYKVVATNGP